jgi:DNA-directed RNA polymerase specialized sigma24 family protein
MKFALRKSKSKQGGSDLLFRRIESELDGLYDFCFLTLNSESLAQEALKRILKKVVARSKRENYEKYWRLWLYRIAVEVIIPLHSRALAESVNEDEQSFPHLSLEEKLTVFLHERLGFAANELSALLQISEGRAGRELVYGREKVARSLGLSGFFGSLGLRERISLHRDLPTEVGACDYRSAMRAAQLHVKQLPLRPFQHLGVEVRERQLMPLVQARASWSWTELSWHHRLGVEATVLSVVGVMVAVVMPWLFSRVNTDAMIAGRWSDVLQPSVVASQDLALNRVSPERLLASSTEEAIVDIESQVPEVQDEFAEMEFPSGDSFEVGTAPLAPSRQAAAVYRLIVQSPSPREMIPQVRSLFAQKNVRERELSGRVMPGGVYFDGVTNVGTYPYILKEIQKLGQTKTYSHRGTSRNAADRARVIVWVQQI